MAEGNNIWEKGRGNGNLGKEIKIKEKWDRGRISSCKDLYIGTVILLVYF